MHGGESNMLVRKNKHTYSVRSEYVGWMPSGLVVAKVKNIQDTSKLDRQYGGCPCYTFPHDIDKLSTLADTMRWVPKLVSFMRVCVAEGIDGTKWNNAPLVLSADQEERQCCSGLNAMSRGSVWVASRCVCSLHEWKNVHLPGARARLTKKSDLRKSLGAEIDRVASQCDSQAGRWKG